MPRTTRWTPTEVFARAVAGCGLRLDSEAHSGLPASSSPVVACRVRKSTKGRCEVETNFACRAAQGRDGRLGNYQPGNMA